MQVDTWETSHLQRTDPLVCLTESDLDFHNVLGLGERVLDLAGTSAFQEFGGACPPGLNIIGDGVTGEGPVASIASFHAAADHAAAPPGAYVVGSGHHPDLGDVPNLDGAFDGREGFLVGLDEDEHLRWLNTKQYMQARIGKYDLRTVGWSYQRHPSNS